MIKSLQVYRRNYLYVSCILYIWMCIVRVYNEKCVCVRACVCVCARAHAFVWAWVRICCVSLSMMLISCACKFWVWTHVRCVNASMCICVCMWVSLKNNYIFSICHWYLDLYSQSHTRSTTKAVETHGASGSKKSCCSYYD